MLDSTDAKEGLVVPRWLRLDRALASGELSIPRAAALVINKETETLFEKDKALFRESKDPILAAELMGTAIVLGDDTLATELANFVLSTQGIAAPSRHMAESLVDRAVSFPIEEPRKAISETRRRLGRFGHDAFAWAHLARLHTIQGNLSKARRALQVALSLAPNDRYIVRAAVRFYLHAGEDDAAYDVVVKASSKVRDPWLDATRLNIALLIGNKVRRQDRSIPRDLSDDKLFHFSELIATTAAVHLHDGRKSRAKDALRLAWRNPSANVVTQGEWIRRHHFRQMDTSGLDLNRSSEAQTWHAFSQLDLDAAQTWNREWELDEPYSESVYAAGSYIACLNGKPKEAIEIVRRGLIANPHSFSLQNNLCYALLRADEVSLAAEQFRRIPADEDRNSTVFRDATEGLLRYKQGNVPLGRELYQRAIATASKLGERNLASRASLLLALAELENTPSPNLNIVRSALAEAEPIEDTDVIAVRRKVIAAVEAWDRANRSTQHSNDE